MYDTVEECVEKRARTRGVGWEAETVARSGSRGVLWLFWGDGRERGERNVGDAVCVEEAREEAVLDEHCRSMLLRL